MQSPFVQQQLSELDRAGAKAETAVGRRSFLGKGIAAAAAAVGLSTSRAEAAPTAVRDQFRFLREHENAHVDFLVAALGDAARPRPTFVNLVQPNLATFVAVSQALENTGVGAYLGAAPFILDPGYLGAAASIALIEARHAGFLNVYRSQPVTLGLLDGEQQFELPLTVAQVVGPPGNAGSLIVDLNGGPPVSYDQVRSEENDIAILNFALALEYLEAEFYNVNVNKFFRV